MAAFFLTLTAFILATVAQEVADDGAPAQLQTTIASLDAQGIQGCMVATSNADGAAVVIHNCNTIDAASKTWLVVNGGPSQETPPPGPIKIFGDKCLDVTNGLNQNGNKLQIWTCDPNSQNKNQLFNYGGEINWAGTTKNVDLTNGNGTDGNPIQIWDQIPFNKISNQEWPGYLVPNLQTVPENVNFGGNFRFNATPFEVLCISASSNEDGAIVGIDRCVLDNDGPGVPRAFPNSNDTLILPANPLTGQIRTFGNKCLDVKDGVDADGTKLQLWTCSEGNTNQQFKTSYNGTLVWAGKGKCIDLTNGNLTLGNQLQVWSCTGGENQKWLYSN